MTVLVYLGFFAFKWVRLGENWLHSLHIYLQGDTGLFHRIPVPVPHYYSP